MTINFDSETISIPCPKCGKKLKEQLGRLKRQKHITCPTCGRITVNTEKFVSAERSVDKEIAKLSKKITIKF